LAGLGGEDRIRNQTKVTAGEKFLERISIEGIVGNSCTTTNGSNLWENWFSATEGDELTGFLQPNEKKKRGLVNDAFIHQP
jgi:hypothetical protein